MRVSLSPSYRQINEARKVFGTLKTKYLDNGYAQVPMLEAVPTSTKSERTIICTVQVPMLEAVIFFYFL